MRTFLISLGVLAALAAEALSAAAADAGPPNILLILADDLGYGDLRCYQTSSRIPTPNLDRLAAEGRRYTDAHTPSAVCSPTRYGLLTGRYAWRTWLKRSVLDGFDPPLIELGRPTIASILKQHGYETAGFGKWHVGMTWTDRAGKPLPRRTENDFRAGTNVDFTRPLVGGPWDVGFDHYFGIAGSLDMPPYAFLENRRVIGPMGPAGLEAKDLFVNQAAGATAAAFDLPAILPTLTRRAAQFIGDRTADSQPYFVYLALTSPHLPISPSPEWVGRSGAGMYGDFVMETDALVGEVLAALTHSGLADNTIVIFTSDNGGLWHVWDPKERDDVAAYQPTPRGRYNAEHGHHSNGALRGTKADIYEGGHRVPLIIRWPNHAKAGATSSALVELNDLCATLADIVGHTLPSDAAEDSFSFLTDLTGRPPSRPVRSFAIHHSIQGVFGIREGDWKLVPTRGSGGFSTPRDVTAVGDEPRGQLYNLAQDPAETRNVWSENPGVVAHLQARLEAVQRGSRTRP